MDEGIDALKRNDFARAAKELRPLAEKGNAEAQYRVGLMYEYGKGFPQDKVQAVSWLRVQWVVEAPKDYKVEKMTGEIKPGSMLTGRIVGGMGKTTWVFDFDVKLPEKDAAAGMTCGK